jgi:hypothetical protein
VQKNQPELPGNHLLKHLRAVADQVDLAAVQGDLAADGHKVEPAELVADQGDLAKNLLNQTKGIFNVSILPLLFSYGENEEFE